jgi:hypothetical protein
MTQLLTPEQYDFIPRVFEGHTVGIEFMRGLANPGDEMIQVATRQVFEFFDIPLVDYYGNERECTIIAWGGGGNMGCKHPDPVPGCIALRRELLSKSRGLPIVILPQSWSTVDEFPADIRFCRERISLLYAPPGAQLAPDMGLAYRFDGCIPDPSEQVGICFREDWESIHPPQEGNVNPTPACVTPDEYILLASQFEAIHTDILHFAVAGLIAGRDVTLYPNIYHKNQSMWETWLHDFGCKWSHLPPCT